MTEQLSMSTENARRWRIARWSTGALLLLTPLIAMQFSSAVNWGPEDFIFGAFLIFGALGAYELISKPSSDTAYRIGLAVSIGAAFLLLWVNGAVGITDGPADIMYPGVAAVGVIGALVAQFRPRGMSLAMAAAALTMVLVSILALVTGSVPAFNSAFEILGITLFFVVLFSGSALLFREAAQISTGDHSPETDSYL